MGLMQLIPDAVERFNVRNAFDTPQNLRDGLLSAPNRRTLNGLLPDGMSGNEGARSENQCAA